MKKILYIEGNADGTIGGSYYSLLHLVKGLNKLKYEPHVMFFQNNVLVPEFKKAVKSVYINKDVRPSRDRWIRTFADIIRWPYSLLRDVILPQYNLRKILNEIQPDLVHLNNGYGGKHEWMLACYLNKIHVVSHDRGTRYPCKFRSKLFARFLDAIISVSESYKNNVIKQKLKVKRIKRVYNGLDPDIFYKTIDSAVCEAIKKEYDIRNDQPVVGIIGNINRWKGQLVVVKALKIVRQTYPNIICLIVGSVSKGSEKCKHELSEYILNNRLTDNVIITGFRKDTLQVLGILDVLIHASTEPEPFSRVILEGMSAGRPIVATNSGGTSEQIVNGETGILVKMNDPNAMAEGIIYYLSDMKRATEIGEKGRQRLVRLFSIKRMVNEIENIYEDIFRNS